MKTAPPNDTATLITMRGDCFVAKVRLLAPVPAVLAQATTQCSLGLKSAARCGFTRNDTIVEMRLSCTFTDQLVEARNESREIYDRTLLLCRLHEEYFRASVLYGVKLIVFSRQIPCSPFCEQTLMVAVK
jgi:hypothetical protein